MRLIAMSLAGSTRPRCWFTCVTPAPATCRLCAAGGDCQRTDQRRARLGGDPAGRAHPCRARSRGRSRDDHVGTASAHNGAQRARTENAVVRLTDPAVVLDRVWMTQRSLDRQPPPVAGQPQRPERADAARVARRDGHGPPVRFKAPRGARDRSARDHGVARPGEAPLPQPGTHQRDLGAVDRPVRP